MADTILFVDFCIPFYLGEYLTRNPDADCVILSRDKKAFDPLGQRLVKQRRLRARRVNRRSRRPALIHWSQPARTETVLPSMTTVLSLLQKYKARPRKRKGPKGSSSPGCR